MPFTLTRTVSNSEEDTHGANITQALKAKDGSKIQNSLHELETYLSNPSTRKERIRLIQDSYHFMARVVAEAALCNIKKTEKAAQTYKSEVILSNAKELMTPEDTSNGAKDSESEQLSNASSTPLNYDP